MSYFGSFNSTSSLFGTGSSSSTNLFSLASQMSMIKTSSYKKLLQNHFYGSSGTSGTSSSSSSSSGNVLDKLLSEKRNPTVSEEVSEANENLTSGLSYLKSSISTLQNSNTYKDTENGSTAADKVAYALKTFVSDYNNTVTAAKKSTLSSKTSYVANMMSSSSKYADQLKEIGITIQSNGTLLLDQNKLKNVDRSKVQDLFSSDNIMSYGSTISSRVQFANVGSGTTSTDTSTSTNASASDLKADSNTLASDELYAKVKDAYGNETDAYDIEKILSTAKSFVSNYNDMLNSAESSSNSGVLANLSYIKQKTSDNVAKLEQFGFSVDNKGRLTLNDDKFKSSDMSKVHEFFQDYGSFVANYASRVNYYMTTNAGASSGYTSSAAYNVQAASNYDEAV